MNFNEFLGAFPKDFMWRSIPGIAGGLRTNLVYDKMANSVANGGMTATQMEQAMTSNNMEMSPEQEKHLDNLVAQENQATANEQENERLQNSLLWEGEQLKQLGLSSANVGHPSGGSAGIAQNVMHNNAQARYERNLSMAKSMISLAGSLAGAGIHGDAINMVRAAADKTALTAARMATNVHTFDWLDYDGVKHRKRVTIGY